MILDEQEHDEYLAHYGILRRSGRYPWGSGRSQATRNRSFLDYVNDMKRQGLTDAEIAKGVSDPNAPKHEQITSTQIRAAKTIALNQQTLSKIAMAQRLKDKGYSNQAIADRMNLAGESSVRALLAPGAKDRATVLTKTADMLQSHVDEKGFVDVGAGQEYQVGVSRNKFDASLAVLRERGYEVHSVPVGQLGTKHSTNTLVLCPPGTTQKDAFVNRTKIQQITSFTEDGGHSYTRILPPLSIHPNRVDIKYKDEGGEHADGVIYVRPGVPDVSIGSKRYAQVRIKVGDDHYLKGMAIYKDDLPKGVDLQFNTSKARTNNKFDAMKELQKDQPDYPFGSIVRQRIENPGTPHAKVTSAMNIVGMKEGSYEEGAWGTWKRAISSQVLSKQNPSLAKTQLDATYERRKKTFDEINSLTNPVVKKALLKTFSDETDKAAVHLDAAAIRRQGWHVILPVNTLKPHEIYAPNFKNGEKVVLIRYPHGGTFEIPELTVNNKHGDSKKLLGANPRDVVGIHHSVAQRLSGADFDGDAVLVIPNNSRRVRHSPALEKLKDFDPREQYKLPDGVVFKGNKQRLMGDVSNLITDMTIKNAPHEHIARAVKHSMVVIDADKHNLDHKRSAIDHGIAQLKAEYQGGATKGAATLISRATSQEHVPHRIERRATEGGPIDPKTGERRFTTTGRTKVDKSGKTVPRTIRSTKLAETTDAFKLSSGTPMEALYATHSNKLKALANEARLSMIRTPNLKYSASSKKAYAHEVSSLNSKLKLAKMNAPRERNAQVIGNAAYQAIVNSNPSLTKEAKKKIRYEQIEKARAAVGAKKQLIQITPKEWDAIQNGAISHHQLEQILQNTNIDDLRKLATPRRPVLMTAHNTDRAQQMLARGYTRAEVADQLGVSLSTLDAATE